jgi:hypothetical protein
MRPRTLLILALVVGALLGLVYLAQDKVASTDERAAKAKRLLPLEAEEVTELELEWQGATVKLERDAKPAEPASAEEAAPATAVPEPRRWRITEPFVQRADSEAVDRLVSDLAHLETERELDGAERKDVGLEPPRGRVSWKTPDGEGWLEIGGGVPASQDVVVAASGRRSPVVTSDALIAALSRAPGEWRSREVVTAARDRIERVTLTPPGAPPVVLVRSGETLRLESPVADWVDRDLADGLLTELTGLRIETFLDPPLGADVAATLARSAGAVELALAGATGAGGPGASSALRIEVGGERAPGRRLFRADGQVFESASKLADALARPALAWRSRSWTRFENWRIEKLRVEAAEGAFELVRSEGEWLRDGQKIPFTAATDLLYALTSAKAESLVEGGAGPGTPSTDPGIAPQPALVVTLNDADGNEEVLLLEAPSPAAAGVVPARTRGRDVTLLLASATVEELEAKLAAVRAAQTVEPAPASAVPPGQTSPPVPAPAPSGPSEG